MKQSASNDFSVLTLRDLIVFSEIKSKLESAVNELAEKYAKDADLSECRSAFVKDRESPDWKSIIPCWVGLDHDRGRYQELRLGYLFGMGGPCGKNADTETK